MTQTLLRTGIFLSLVTILGITEVRWPQNRTAPDRRRRWSVNFAIGELDIVAVRLLMPWLAVDAASWSAAHHAGILRERKLAHAGESEWIPSGFNRAGPRWTRAACRAVTPAL